MLWLISGHQLTVSEISTFCIAASYLVALVLEAIRPLWLARARYFLALSFLVAGIVAHLLYLAFVARGAMFSGQGVFVSWADWSLIAALLLVGAATGLMIKRPQNTVAVFLLPMVLVLIGVAELCKEMEPFKGEAIASWGFVHGLALLIGTVSVGLGFSTGIMYLIQSNRLKNKKGPSSGLRLPSLEWLQRFNREALLLSAILLGIGVASGVILGAQPGKELSPTDPAILSSSMMFLWIVGACIFEVVYQPARQGKKVAYVTLANFVFLVLVLTLVLYSGHAGE
ncbi:MAG: cytochrome c biogenesis protein CcsA [Pirellulaceae bacterium]|nr:cytochrome C assembly protein [Planctomycetaceae bacterium]